MTLKGGKIMLSGFDEFMFGKISIAIIFVIVIGFFIINIIKGISEWSKNNASPTLTVPAEIVTKRTKVSGGSGDSSAYTSYYVTFEVESGDRIELKVKGQEYGALVEGDLGDLTFQGSRYHQFKRQETA